MQAGNIFCSHEKDTCDSVLNGLKIILKVNCLIWISKILRDSIDFSIQSYQSAAHIAIYLILKDKILLYFHNEWMKRIQVLIISYY